MLYSNVFAKTQKSSKKFDSKNATYLIKAGFIDQTMSGVYTFLPLGKKVLDKIIQIIREEMNTIGSEVIMPSLSPKEAWQTTGRLESVDVLFKVSGANKLSSLKNDSEYILNPTHEEIITPIVANFCPSYKDLPVAIFQFQSKFRNEARPKTGLLRSREFIMKDLYSFHKSKDEFNEYYESAKKAYSRIYERLGLGDITCIALASGGDFTEDYSHEFQTFCTNGEDEIFVDKKAGLNFNKEVAPSKATPVNEEDSQVKEMQMVHTPNKKTVKEITEFLNWPIEKTIKTVIFENDLGETAVVAIRGDYEVNETKLKKVLGWKTLSVATDETVRKVTGAEVGYAGIVNLPKQIFLIVDDSLEGLKNLECGGNKTDYHLINVNFGRDLPEPEKYWDIKTAKEGDKNPQTNRKYEVIRASEVGNIFNLETKFPDAFGFNYTDDKGILQKVYMGCYGIGVTRLMGVIAEVFSDEKGLIWPDEIAPYKIHLIGLNMENEVTRNKAFEAYMELTKNGVEVLFDDRLDTNAGEKFADADLVGCPYRAVVSNKTPENKIEVRKRNEKESKNITIEELITKAKR